MRLPWVVDPVDKNYQNILQAFVDPGEVQAKNVKTSASINQTPILRRFLGGQTRSDEEFGLMKERQANAINTKINEIKGGVNRGDIPMETGIDQIHELQKRQTKILNEMQSTPIKG